LTHTRALATLQAAGIHAKELLCCIKDGLADCLQLCASIQADGGNLIWDSLGRGRGCYCCSTRKGMKVQRLIS
jgi:hypothetical protein